MAVSKNKQNKKTQEYIQILARNWQFQG